MITELERRKALLWLRDNPSGIWEWSTPGAPSPKVRVDLMREGLIEFDRRRKMFDPITYALTDKGRQILA